LGTSFPAETVPTRVRIKDKKIELKNFVSPPQGFKRRPLNCPSKCLFTSSLYPKYLAFRIPSLSTTKLQGRAVAQYRMPIISYSSRFAGLKLRENLGGFLNGAKFTTHGTDIGLFRHAGLSKLPCPQGINGEADLFLPVQGSPGSGHQAIFFPGTFEASGNVCGMAGNPGGDDPLPYIINRGKTKVF
jgi:hypothetical protein